jgi:TolB-like protein/Tfp pilus assembly protein PilF
MVRQLTAIMFSDMVGYTALMQEDEARAMVDRDRQRAVLDRLIAVHHGEVLQVYGDGTLSIFRSAIEAVRCAVAVQAELRDGDPVALRIGVHTGDIVHDDDGVFGDGVNVASRIQALSVAGGVLISGKVFDEVKNQPDISAKTLGQFSLKNVKRPMAVFAISNEGLSIPKEEDLTTHRVAKRRSVAVLPFVNMSSDPENEFFSDGVTEEIINVLTRINGLQVTARTSSFEFKGHNQDVREIARRLGVTHVLEGSVRRIGPRARVTAQLICAKDGYHLFSNNYDRDLEDVFSVQDEIAGKIVEQLAEHLGPVPTSDPERRVSASHRHDTAAHAEYLRGRFESARFSPEGSRRAIDHFERSLEMDPQCALPHTGLATAFVFLGATGQMDPREAFPRAEGAALAALTLEPDSGETHLALASVKLFYHWDWEGAYHSFQKALSLTPGNADAHHMYSMFLSSIGEHEEAIAEARVAVQLDPLSILHAHALGMALTWGGELDEAEVELETTLAMDPSFRAAIETLGWVHLGRGHLDEAIAVFERLPEQASNRYAGAGGRGYAYGVAGREDDARRMLALLEERTEAQPDVVLDTDYAMVHAGLGEFERTLEYLRGTVEKRMGSVVFFATFPPWDPIRSEPGFTQLLDEVGFPGIGLAERSW